MNANILNAKKEKTRFTLEEIIEPLQQVSTKIDPVLKKVVCEYYQGTKLFLDRLDTEVQNAIQPLYNQIKDIEKNISTEFYTEKDEIIGGVACKVCDKKTIDAHYNSLRKQKQQLLDKIKTIKTTYQEKQNLIVEELQEIREIKKDLQKKKLEYIAILPKRVLTELTKDLPLYTFRDIGNNGKIRIKYIGYNENLDKKITDDSEDFPAPNANLFTLAPVKVVSINEYKEELKNPSDNDYVFPFGFLGWTFNPIWGTCVILLSVIIGGFIYKSWSVFGWSLLTLSLSWIILCFTWILRRFFVGYLAKITLPNTPKKTQERLQQFKKNGFKIYPIVEDGGFIISPLKNYKANPVPNKEPMLITDQNKHSIIIDQYGEFIYEKMMIKKIKEMYAPESIIASLN